MFDPGKRYTYSFPTSIRFGLGVIDELPEYLRTQGLSRPLIVTDRNIKQLHFFESILENLRLYDLQPEVFSGIHANPIKSDVENGRSTYMAAISDCVIGVGGGSALDVARAVALSINNYRDLFDYDDLEDGGKYITGPVPHFVTVPTTSGSGSEVGRAAVISEDESKRKRLLFHPSLLAKMVFADPELTLDLTPDITAATGMDALTHNMEAFLSKGYHPICDGIALRGMHLIAQNLEKAVNAPDATSRANMMMASCMGAIAFQKGLGLVHAMSHPVSTLIDLHHGLANAINLPFGMQFNIKGNEQRFIQIAKSLGIEDASPEKVIEFLFDLNHKIGLPSRLSEVGLVQEQVEPLTELALKDFCLPLNPNEVTRQDFVKLYQEAIG